MRRTALVACSALVLALSACASAQRTTRVPVPVPVPVRPMTPRIAALRDPQTLLKRIGLPPEAKLAPQLETGLLAGHGGLGVGAHRIWRIPLPYRTVVRFFERQHPRGATASSGMLIGRVHIFGSNRELDWSFRPMRPFISSRTLSVMVLALSPHATGVRVEVDDVWHVRPASERLPLGTTTITVQRASWEKIAPITRRITRPEDVARVVRWFNALPLYKLPRHAYFCPMAQYSPPIVISFLSATGRVLAEANITGTGTGKPCQSGIVVTIRGKREPMLAGNFLARVLALVGLPSQPNV